MLLKEIKEE